MNPRIPHARPALLLLCALASVYSLRSQPPVPQGRPAPVAPGAPGAPGAPAPAVVGFGLVLAAATAAEKAEFTAGSGDFRTVETPQTGLGPLFNNTSCVVCHSAPAPGGTSHNAVTRFGRTEDGVFDPLTSLDGTLLHAHAIAPALLEVVPSESNVQAKRIPTPLFGAGLLEAIPDATIEANASEEPESVRGRAAMVADVASGEERVGRFGWKAQHATLLSFSADALNEEIGITNRLFPKAAAPDGNEALLAKYVSPSAPIEDQPNSKTGLSEIDRLANFMRLLAPPPAGGAPSASTVAGQKLFVSTGCASCHTPTLETGPNSSAALANRSVALYSDLLVHDMGALGDGIAQGDASTKEMRTAPLWGLGARGPYLHDGRAQTVAQAILDHAGQGAASSAAYSGLTASEKQQLLAFLGTL